MISGLACAALMLAVASAGAAVAPSSPAVSPSASPSASPVPASAAPLPASGSAAGSGSGSSPSLPSVNTDEAAQQAFRTGVDAARQEHWIDARISFEKAYELSPRPVVLINLAGAQARTGRLTEAAKNYRLILNDETSVETASFRRAAGEVLPALEARIPRVRLRPSGLTPEDVIQIDGVVVPTEAVGGGIPLDPGEHTLVVKHSGTERARVLFSLAERELRYITLPLPSLVQRPPSPSAVAALDATDGSSESPSGVSGGRSWWRSPWTWTTVAVVVGASVATILVLNRPDHPYVGTIPPGVVVVR